LNTYKDKTVLITGASGFLGKHTVPYLDRLFNVKTLSLRQPKNYARNLKEVDVIVYLAGIAHQSKKINDSIYFQINRDLTISFAAAAKKAGVKHFIFISTVKVFGEGGKQIYNEDSMCSPSSAYGKSKLEAERELLSMASDNFAVSIIRPAVVYGAGAKGNIEKLVNLINKFPLIPLGGIQNKRSMVYIGNFLALLKRIIDTQTPGVFLSTDNALKSTSEIVNEINRLNPKSKKIIVFPRIVRTLLHKLKPELYDKLFDDFVVDNTLTNRKLNFEPPYTFEEGLREMFGTQEQLKLKKSNVSA
jgi:nucleoside-diphosphate-sugar epimerase